MYVEMEKLEAEFYPAVDRVVSNSDSSHPVPRFDPTITRRLTGSAVSFQFLRSMTPMHQDIATSTSSASTGWTPSTRGTCSRSWLQPSGRRAAGHEPGVARCIAERSGKPDPSHRQTASTWRPPRTPGTRTELGGDAVIHDLLRDCRRKLSVRTRHAARVCFANAARSRWRRGHRQQLWRTGRTQAGRMSELDVQSSGGHMSPKHRQLHEHHGDTACLMASASTILGAGPGGPSGI